jgi:hypothetical protein
MAVPVTPPHKSVLFAHRNIEMAKDILDTSEPYGWSYPETIAAALRCVNEARACLMAAIDANPVPAPASVGEVEL